MGGWAIDTGAPEGTGVDAIHLWAFKDSDPNQARFTNQRAESLMMMRILAGLLGAVFVFTGFRMTSWRYKGETRERQPTMFVRVTTVALGILLFYWSIRW